MDTTPRVVIGMPVFNGEKYIRQAIDSILNQTYGDFELFISDNASTDATENICREYRDKDERIRYFRSSVNKGAAWNYNQLVNRAKGEFFKWASHDDLLAPTYLQRCVETFDDYDSDVVLCYPRTVRIGADGEFLDNHDDMLDLWMRRPYIRLKHILENQGHWNPIFGLMRLETLKGTKLHGTYWACDTVLLAEMALRGRFIEIPERLFFRRYHKETSYEANVTLDERVGWLDPHRQGRRRNSLFALRLLYEQSKAIKSAPLSLVEKLQCLTTTVGHWIVEWRAVAGDMKRILRLSTRHVH